MFTTRTLNEKLTPAHGLKFARNAAPACTSATTLVCSAAVNRVAAVGPFTITTPSATLPIR